MKKTILTGITSGLSGLISFVFLFTLIILEPVLLETLSVGVTIGVLTVLFCIFVCSTIILMRQVHKKENKIEKIQEMFKKKERILINFQTQFESLLCNASIGIAKTDLKGNIIRANSCFQDLFSCSEKEASTLNLFSGLPIEEKNKIDLSIQKMIDNEIESYQYEQIYSRKDNEKLWINTTIFLFKDENQQPVSLIGQIQNITYQKNAEERLSHMAYHDPLTGLANRNKLEHFVNHILADARRHQQSFALLFLDLDNFKNINDTSGHDAGDILLQIIAERLLRTVRNTDMVARLAGDEFVIVITDVKKTESVAVIAQKTLENVLEPIIIKGQEVYITTSIGISIYPYDGQTMEHLMKNADLALYRAKEQGRNNYQFYTVEMTGKAQEKMAIQNALGHALLKNEFTLYYQPKMDIRTRQVTGLEALLRWKNEKYGLITPREVIDLAEETGLIVPLSEWIVRTACQQLKEWHKMGYTSLTIGINCATKQFKQSSFINNLFNIITETGIPTSSVEIEITEALIMKNTENTLRVLYGLKDLGIQIVIDNFGSGYCSLNNLKRLTIDKIKIDRSFINQIPNDPSSEAIVSAIIAMATKLGIKSVAEGVETRSQYTFLLEEGCSEIQGYYITQPLSKEAITEFLRHPMPDAELVSQSEVTE